MFKNYITVAIRALIANRLFSIINIGGLALGLAASILVLLFVKHELSYDQWIPEGHRIEKLELTIPIPGRDTIYMGQMPPALIPLLPEHFPGEIEAATRFHNMATIVRSENEQFSETINLVDGNFFEIFDIPMISGNRSAIATKNSSILLSENAAFKFFGAATAEGQTLTIEFGDDILVFEVAGVFRDIPENSHIDFDYLVLLDTKREGWDRFDESFSSAFMQAGYAKFFDGVDVRSVEERLPAFYLNVAPPRGDESDTYDYRTSRKINFINVRDVHLYSNKIQQIKPIGDIKVVVSFMIVAALILLIAAINFTNLATTRAIRRAKEVSLRKVLGAKRSQLVAQFLGESVIVALIALAIAVAIVEMALPTYASYLDKSLTLSSLSSPIQIAGTIAVVVILGVLGGLYPALFLSGFRPARILGSSTSSVKGTASFRQALLVFQFAISIGLIVSTVTVRSQMDLVREVDLGFEKERKLAVFGVDGPQVAPNEATIRQELLQVPGVESATLMSDPFPLIFYNDMNIDVPSQNISEGIDTDRVFVDAYFFDVFDIKPVAGRLYSEEYTADTLVRAEDTNLPWTRSAVVTETFVRKAGFPTPADAIGELLVVSDYSPEGQPLHATVVGVISDLHVRSLHENTAQMVFFASDAVLNVMTLNIVSGDMPATLAAIDDAWRRVVPTVPINRSFIADDYNSLYDKERRQGDVFAAFSVFAVLVACLGLFGLAAFTADQRTKEIGLRKVMGARIIDIVKLLSWQFVKPVLWANLIAWPIAYLFLSDWLESFVMRVELSWVPFLWAGITALSIAWVTVSTHAFRVARTSPIHALRYE